MRGWTARIWWDYVLLTKQLGFFFPSWGWIGLSPGVRPCGILRGAKHHIFQVPEKWPLPLIFRVSPLLCSHGNFSSTNFPAERRWKQKSQYWCIVTFLKSKYKLPVLLCSLCLFLGGFSLEGFGSLGQPKMLTWKISVIQYLRLFWMAENVNGFLIQKLEKEHLLAFQVNSTQNDKLCLHWTKMFIMALVKSPITRCLTWLNPFLL